LGKILLRTLYRHIGEEGDDTVSAPPPVPLLSPSLRNALTDSANIPIYIYMGKIRLVMFITAFLILFPHVAALAAWVFVAWLILVAAFGENAFISMRELGDLRRWEEIVAEAIRLRPYLPNIKKYLRD